MKTTFLLAVLSACVACPPSTPPAPPEPDVVVVDGAAPYEGSDVFGDACANLHTLQCAEGADVALCVRTFQAAQSSHRTDVRGAACIATATSKAVARACGLVDCH